MEVLKDFKAIYSVVFKKTLISYFKYIIMIPLMIVYASVYEVSKILLGISIGQLGSGGAFLAGISSWFIMSFILSDFLGHLDALIFNRKISLNSLGSNRMTYFSSVLSATAIPNIVIYGLVILLRIEIEPYWLYLFYLIYAVPEVIYQKQKDRTDIFIYGHHFIKENWLLWGVINLVFALSLFGIDQYFFAEFIVPRALTMIYSDMNVYIVSLFVQIMKWIVLSIPLMFVLIFRGYLFKILSVSSKRKREYMRNIYGE